MPCEFNPAQEAPPCPHHEAAPPQGAISRPPQPMSVDHGNRSDRDFRRASDAAMESIGIRLEIVEHVTSDRFIEPGRYPDMTVLRAMELEAFRK